MLNIIQSILKTVDLGGGLGITLSLFDMLQVTLISEAKKPNHNRNQNLHNMISIKA